MTIQLVQYGSPMFPISYRLIFYRVIDLYDYSEWR